MCSMLKNTVLWYSYSKRTEFFVFLERGHLDESKNNHKKKWEFSVLSIIELKVF